MLFSSGFPPLLPNLPSFFCPLSPLPLPSSLSHLRSPDVERYFFEDISRHFKVEHVPSEAQDPAFSSPFIHIVSLTRRRVSLGEFDRH